MKNITPRLNSQTSYIYIAIAYIYHVNRINNRTSLYNLTMLSFGTNLEMSYSIVCLLVSKATTIKVIWPLLLTTSHNV